MKIKIFTFCVFLTTVTALNAQVFQKFDKSVNGIPATDGIMSMCVGDVNKDGIDDIFIGKLNSIYYGSSDNKFVLDQNLTSSTNNIIASSACAFVDYDNDGYLDLLYFGDVVTPWTVGKHPVTRLYHNQGPDMMYQLVEVPTTIPALALHDVYNNANNQGISFGDYNGDGFPDLLIRGTTDTDNAGLVVNKLFKNNAGVFQEILLPIDGISALPNSYAGNFPVWFDYNNDGKLDIIMGGKTDAGGNMIKIYKNNGNDTFTEVSTTGLFASTGGNIVTLDFDKDGLMDIAYMGTVLAASSPTGTDGTYFMIFKNNGNGNFSCVYNPAVMPFKDSWSAGNVSVGDFDGDGIKEILSTAGATSNNVNDVFKYMGDWVMKSLIIDTDADKIGDATLDSQWEGLHAIGDFNGDGRLDFVHQGAQNGNNFNLHINVEKNYQIINFSQDMTVKLADGTVTLKASTPAKNLTVSYSSSDPSVASISGNILTLHKLGTTTITATQDGASDFYAATPVSKVLNVVLNTGIEELAAVGCKSFVVGKTINVVFNSQTDSNISVFSIDGSCLKSVRSLEMNNKIAVQESGVYIVKITTNGKNYCQKVIVQ